MQRRLKDTVYLTSIFNVSHLDISAVLSRENLNVGKKEQSGIIDTQSARRLSRHSTQSILRIQLHM